MSAEADRRKASADVHPERRMEDVKKAAAEALERFEKEAADLKLAFERARENGYSRAAS